MLSVYLLFDFPDPLLLSSPVAMQVVPLASLHSQFHLQLGLHCCILWGEVLMLPVSEYSLFFASKSIEPVLVIVLLGPERLLSLSLRRVRVCQKP